MFGFLIPSLLFIAVNYADFSTVKLSIVYTSRSTLELEPYVIIVSPPRQCHRAAVVQRVSQRVQQQPVLASLLHPAPVQSAPRSTNALLLSAAIQRQLQDDGAQWLDPRNWPGT